ncbi:MAG: TonB-dependent receptor [Melioribacteraceae bacterium]|nr:TonB-dependent receptor [Melioribacteraceae bacterium]
MKSFMTFFLILVIPILIFSQNKLIEGIILNSNNDTPIKEVNILIQDSNKGTVTNSKGEFKLENDFNKPVILKISYVGFKTESVNVSPGQTNLTVYLTPLVIPIGETIVTSARYHRQIKDIPFPLEIVDSEEIEKSSVVSLSDALDKKPGLSISRDGIWGTHINIRGLSKNNIVTLIDGNRIETGTSIAAGMSMIDLNDVERIEVIKSASSPLYGSGALGGVVNIISKESQYDSAFFLTGSVSSNYNSVNSSRSGNIFLKSGGTNWFAKINGTVREAANVETPKGELENSQFKDNNISASIGVQPFEDHEVVLKLQRFYAEDVGIPGGAPFAEPAKARYPEEKRELYSVEYRINNLVKSMSNLSIKYFHQLINRRVELIPNANTIVKPNADHNINGIQLQTEWTLGKNNLFIAGIDAWNRHLRSWRTKEIKAKNQIIGERPVPVSDYRSIGVFAQDEIQIIKDKLSLTLGGRADQINVKNDDSYNPDYIIVNGVKNDSPPTKMLLWKSSEENDISYSANAGFLFKAINDIDLTLDISHSFRSPSLEERYQFIQLGSITYLGNSDLDPEKGTFFDFGVRVWKPAFSFTGNVFVNYMNNLVIDEWQNDQLYVKNNVGKARLYGFDFSINYNIYKDFVLYSSASYVRGEDTENNLDLPEIPPLNGRLGLRFNAAEYASLDISGSFSSDQEKVSKSELSTAGYSLFDLSINSFPIKLGSIKLNLFAGIQNIFDRGYRNHLSTYRGIIRLEPGRNIFAKAVINF